MDKQIRDKFLTELVGKCWHEINLQYQCASCPKQKCNNSANPDFSTWEGFGLLWDYCQSQEWWRSFGYHADLNRGQFLNTAYIHPDGFADAVYAYLAK